MIVDHAAGPHLSMLGLEGLLALASLGICVAWPRLGSKWWRRVEIILGKLARRRALSVLTVGAGALILRLALIPFFPIPLPFIPDDFSFLLAADTFAHGRLANPTPAMWTHFETIHITMVPTYMTMYFPAQGLILAAGKVLFGNPWFGLLCVTALMCAAICWMLQAWLPPGWALWGGMIAVLRLGLFSYWINTYTGAGCVAALGGALVLGAFPRILKTARYLDCVLLGLGIVLLALSRPYEGFLLCLPVAFVLVRWLLAGKNRPTFASLARRVAIPLALIAAAALCMGHYDKVAFGNPLTLPYAVDRATYATAPYWIWQSPRPAPVYRHKEMRDFYFNEQIAVANYQDPSELALMTLVKPIVAIRFFAGITLLPALIMLRRVSLDRRIRFFVFSGLVWLPGMFIAIFLLPHYLAPFTAAFYVIGLQALRHLRVWKPIRLPIGRSMVRFTALSCVLMAGARSWAGPLHLNAATWPGTKFISDWYGPGPFGAARAHVEEYLDGLPGKQLALVRYSNNHDPINEWVYNAADLDGSKVIWAREMDTANNQEIMNYYSSRQVWLVEPDATPAGAIPYPGSLSMAEHLRPKGEDR